MLLRDIPFGAVFNAPGACGFFGEGYPFHRLWQSFGMTWQGTRFVAKTTTLQPRLEPTKGLGNMPLRSDRITPIELVPRCIVVESFTGHVLNAVGLSGPGARYLFEQGRWQARTEPFMLSFMSVAPTKAVRQAELREFIQLFEEYRSGFRAPVALQLNFACPNAGLHQEELFGEIEEALTIASGLDIPLIPNFNPTVPIDLLREIAKHPACDALWIANTIPWGDPRIPWRKLFGSDTSPLVSRGFKAGGGLSGPMCLPFVIERLVQARDAGITKPIVAGNGIQSTHDVRLAFQAGAAAIALGVIGMVRPWRMREVIQTAFLNQPAKS